MHTKKLSESNALIVGLARNCEKGLQNTLPRLNKFKNTFKNVDFRIVTNDSTDNTENVLGNWSFQENNIKVIQHNNLEINATKRTARIAICRNIYLEELRQLKIDKKIDYLLVLDLDGLNSTLVDDPIFTKLIEYAPSNWGGIFANTRGNYYDIWALRHDTWCPNDCFIESKNYRRNLINIIKNGGIRKNNKKAFKKFITDRQKKISPSNKIISVESAFNGFGIYKTKYLENASYVGLDLNGREICEHVHFNQCVRDNGAKLYIIPKLLNDPHW